MILLHYIKEWMKLLFLKIVHLEKVENLLMCFIELRLTNQNNYELMFLTKDEEVQQLLQNDSNKTYDKLINSLAEVTNSKMNPSLIWSVFLSLHGFIIFYIHSDSSYEDVRKVAEFHVKTILKNIV